MNKIYRYWYCDESGEWLMHVSPEWEYSYYGFRPNGKSDLLYFMGLYALITGDVKAIKACIKLLNERKRWPDSLNVPFDAKNLLQKLMYKIRWKIYDKLFPNKIVFAKYRPQHTVTRDVFTTVFAAIYWHQYEMIQNLKVPLRIQTPAFYYWVKYLKTHNEKYKKRYEWFVNVKDSTPGYVKHLNCLRAWIARSDVKEDILKHIPPWNILCRMMCGEQVHWEEIYLYQGSTGYLWQADKPKDNPTICTEHEPFQMDEEILKFVYNNRTW